ncbi:hypothetical protein HDU84_003718 [Entophlyctis sp. JEL0112]|nr:hypothetical protein HDU84_003718 [Entophlyctis sp. JEL0112]
MTLSGNTGNANIPHRQEADSETDGFLQSFSSTTAAQTAAAAGNGAVPGYHNSSSVETLQAHGAPITDRSLSKPEGERYDALDVIGDGDIAGDNSGSSTASSSRLNTWLRRIGAEVRGVEWVPPTERQDKNLWDSFFMWFSFNIAVTTAPVGSLAGPVFGLGLRDALLTIVFFNLVACATVAFLATLGPVTGLRQMIVARFSFGFWGASFISFLNVITQLAFSLIAVLVGAQTLIAMWTSLSMTGGIIIVALVTLVICFFGYKLVHIYERYMWIGVFIIFILMFSSGAGSYTVTDTTVGGQDLVTSVLALGGLVFGTAAGWGPVASDYNMYLPEQTSTLSVFAMTFFGNFLSLCFAESLGAVMTTAFAAKPDWSDAFDQSWGQLMSQALSNYGTGWQKLFVLILALSAVTINIPTTYSTALSIQALHPTFQRVPRAVWVIIGTIIYTVVSIAGQNSFLTLFQNILSLLSYWTALFFVVLFEEHYLFRRSTSGKGNAYTYRAHEYNSPEKLPLGVAGGAAIVVSVVAAVVGMSQAWFVGPVAQAIGGGDLGFELVLLFAGVVYPLVRVVELRVWGR